MENIKISKRERDVLAFYAEEYHDEDRRCLYMRYVEKELKLEHHQVKRAVRSLARKGLMELVRGLVDGDGMLAGSGYCATEKGALLILPCKVCKIRIADMDDDTCFLCYDQHAK